MTASVLTIAGSDPCCGAGIQADIKTFSALGVKGASVVACLTAQNGAEFGAAFKVPADFIDAQFACLMRAEAVNSAKTGMLFDEETTSAVCRNIRKFSIKKVVCDPVIRSGSGAELLSKGGVEALKKELLPLCEFATPNMEEAGALCGTDVVNTDDMKKAAREIASLGVKKVVVTGGHAPENETVSDIFFDGENFFEIKRKREKTAETVHGTGCVFSSALCAFLALGRDGFEAAAEAGRFTAQTIKTAGEAGL